MVDAGKAVEQSKGKPPAAVAPGAKLIGGVVFGLAFGFLLQKGGVAKFNVLIGQLLFQDWTVVKIMLTAILVGMVGIFILNRFAKVNLHLKPTRLAANCIGGLIFGAGFGLLGYCPGTNAAALGQGSWDALFGVTGLVIGSWLFAESSAWLKKTIESWGDLGKVLLPDLLRVPRLPFVAAFAIVLILVLAAIHRMSESLPR